jgi:hypothetical protein
MNPNLEKAVGHIILSWSPNDIEKLNSEVMLENAKEYLRKMDILNTQFLIVQHTDRNHPHVHIIYNRVDYNGQTIANNNLWKMNAKVTNEMTRTHGYYMAPGKDDVNRNRLKGGEKVKYQIYDAIKFALKNSRSWADLKELLKYKGIQVEFKYARGSSVIQGVSFSKNGIVFKGSQIDRTFSYAKIDQFFIDGIANKTTIHSGSDMMDAEPIFGSNPDHLLDKEITASKDHSTGNIDWSEIFSINISGGPGDSDDEKRKRKRNLKR